MINISKTIILLISFITISSYSKDCKSEDIKKVKYGKVTKEELLMKTYELDTAAQAVVLYEYAEFIPERFMFFQQIRVKVLKKNATDIASMVFEGRVKANLKGCTYNLENGEIVKTKLKSESIFEEQVIADYYQTRVAMPNVKEGSVFEIEIEQESIPSSFEIQRSIPVVYGAVVFPRHQDINIRIKEIGYLGYAFKGDNVWIVKDMPAFKSEPYIISENDYRVRLEFELISYMFTTTNNIIQDSFATSWENVAEKLEDSKFLGAKIKELSLYINDLADSIKAKSKNDDEKLKNAYDAIRRIHWNKQPSCYVSQDLKKTFQQREGNTADINLNLIVLLKKLDFKSYPVALSTRSNGKLSKFAPSLSKINYVIAAVDLPNGTKYLDASDEFVPLGMIPDRLYGCVGLPLIDEKHKNTIVIEPTQKDKKVTFSNLKIDSTGNINGKIAINRVEYNAVDFKNMLKGKPDQDTYIRELESDNAGWIISNYKFNNLNDPYSDFTSEYDVSYSTSIGMNDLLVFNPMVFVKMNNNPFKSDKRNLPINYYEPIEYSSIVNIDIPKNYTISEMPKNVELVNPDKSVKFSYSIAKADNKIQIKAKFNVMKVKFEAMEYSSLRSLYEMMLQKLNESIILKKS